ncbi:MAG: hypothetical protein QNK37_02070 [Acidobacteriota bacterium]|nr:hypothetical protein [Acidobacteriota bacterium]
MKKWIPPLILALAISAMASDKVPAGFDVFQTLGGGATAVDFADEPIPAGFFCDESPAFKSKIKFEGVPLATEPAGLLGSADTIIERMDDAVFKDGQAVARMRIRAIHLESRYALDTACGQWQVRAGLVNDQPVTEMRYKQVDEVNGNFFADLVLNIRLTFTNTETNETRQLDRLIHFTEFNSVPYHLAPARGPVLRSHRAMGKKGGSQLSQVVPRVMVDTDADGIADDLLGLVATTTTGTKVDDVAVYPGWVCPPGVYPPDPRCILWRLVHEDRDHVHMVLPPCDPDVIIWTEQTAPIGNVIEQEATLDVGWCLYNGPVLNDQVVSQLRNLEARGLLDISAEELIEEIIAKAQR